MDDIYQGLTEEQIKLVKLGENSITEKKSYQKYLKLKASQRNWLQAKVLEGFKANGGDWDSLKAESVLLTAEDLGL